MPLLQKAWKTESTLQVHLVRFFLGKGYIRARSCHCQDAPACCNNVTCLIAGGPSMKYLHPCTGLF